eukprot:TRINITY_DN1976_c0_g1_i1.p1 TRINITY_DN1976_c0_g1~~TRINITY_DN1976_c0_g1_i1.p1  ORF type:complete len:501 (-),score=77.48 TRINITY_DN1976_c0_g1_i1:282-1784(-)
MARHFSCATVALVFALGPLFQAAVVEAGSFLNGKRWSNPSKLLSNDELTSIFLAEIDVVLGGNQTTSIQRRVAPMEATLRNTLSALPRDEQGRYGHVAVGYALRRLFVKKHGWYMFLFDSSYHDSSDSTLAESLPEHLQGLFEARLGSHGLTAHEVALLAAALENLVQREAIERLDEAYDIEGISVKKRGMSLKQVDSLIDTYMAMGILTESAELIKNSSKRMSPRKTLRSRIEEAYDGWSDVCSFVREVRTEHFSDRTAFDYADVVELIEHINDRYGRWQNRECDIAKERLLSIEEEQGNGRVTLAMFYNKSLEEEQPFNESRAFLRQLGVLDESQVGNPRVLMSNYILSSTNCVGESAYYKQCCINACENIFEKLEGELASPDAEPDDIAALIPTLSPELTALQPRLLQRLYSIADSSTGRVVLHSRSFAQWLHHVFPRDCPYPTVSNGSRPMNMISYQRATGRTALASLKQMRAKRHFKAQCFAVRKQDGGSVALES